MHPPAGAGVLALGVLAHHHPVEIARLDAAQGTPYAGQQARRAHVGVLIEALADGEAKAPQRHVVGDVRRADRAEVDGIEAAQLLEAVLGHHPPGAAVMLRAPVEGLHLEAQAGRARLQGVQHLEPRRDHLLADAIPRQRRTLVLSPVLPPFSRATTSPCYPPYPD